MRYTQKQMKQERRKAVARSRTARKLVSVLFLVAGFAGGTVFGYYGGVQKVQSVLFPQKEVDVTVQPVCVQTEVVHTN